MRKAERLRVRRATATDGAAWDAFVAAKGVPAAGAWAWADLLTAMYPVIPVPLLAERAGAPAGVLMAYVTGPLRKRRLCSTRYGLLADDDEAALALGQAACATAAEFGAARVELTSGRMSHPLPGQLERCTLLLDLSPGEDAVWASLRGKTRNMIRKGQRVGLSMQWGWDNADAFWRVYRDEMASKRVSFHRLSFFREMGKRLGDRAALLTIADGGTVVGGTVVVFGSDEALYPYQAVRRAYRATAPSQVMIWEVMQRCIALGIRTLDMGESTVGGATYLFKQNFGGQVTPIYYYLSPLHQAEVGHRPNAPSWRARIRATTPTPLWWALGVREHGRGRVV